MKNGGSFQFVMWLFTRPGISKDEVFPQAAMAHGAPW